jgi:hypothetical protein
MAYSTANQPRLETQSIAGTRSWLYVHTDASAVVDASGYFTDGYNLGMRSGDIVRSLDTSTGIVSTHHVVVSGTTINLRDGVAATSTTNTD